MNLRAIALDLDGTLLGLHHTILSENLDALFAAQARGIEVVLVTGRHYIAAHTFHNQLELDTRAVCCNGIYLYDFRAGMPLHGDPMPVSDRLALLSLVRREGLHSLAYLGDRFCYETGEAVLNEVIVWAKGLPDAVRPCFERVDNLASVLADAPMVWKMAITHHDPSTLPALAHALEFEMGLGVVQTGLVRLDVGRPGHSKASGMRRWLDSRGLRPEQIVAFGDIHNDISVLGVVGHGVAMAEAPTLVRTQADEV
jgi:Cof subfamily protein (haloacid dehalogenase superfamily)